MNKQFDRNFWRGKKVFVTGHTGFKGSWLCTTLNFLGAEICGYSLAPNTKPSLFEALELEKEMKSHIADVRDFCGMKEVLETFRPEIVLHLAAQPLVRQSYRDPLGTYSTNVMGTAHVLEAVRSIPAVRAVVIVTTDKVYENDERGKAFSEDDRLGGDDPYSSSKACAELITTAMRKSFFLSSNCRIATARAGNVIGGGDWSDERLIPDFVRAMASGKAIQLRNPAAVRPWQHVLEPTFAYLTLAQNLFQTAAETSADGANTWNFGPALKDTMTVQHVTETIVQLWGGNAAWEISQSASAKTTMHEAQLLQLDISKAQKDLDWKPKWNIERALQMTVEWYKHFGNGASARELCLQQIQHYLGDEYGNG